MDAESGSPETLPLRPNPNLGDNDSCHSSSIISFSSAGATGKSHSRHNSGESLLDVLEVKPGSLNRNATSSELLDVKPLALMRKSSAPVLRWGFECLRGFRFGCCLDDGQRISLGLQGIQFGWYLKLPAVGSKLVWAKCEQYLLGCKGPSLVNIWMIFELISGRE